MPEINSCDPAVFNLDAADAARVIAFLQQAGDTWHAPLWRALGAKRIGLVELRRGASRGDCRRVLRRLADVRRRPIIVMVGDDDHASTGPAGWPGIGGLLRWAAAVVIYSAPGDAAAYEALVSFAVAHRKVLVIETNSAKAGAWIASAPVTAQLLAIVPPPGEHWTPGAVQ
jgi:hypothetical protein